MLKRALLALFVLALSCAHAGAVIDTMTLGVPWLYNFLGSVWNVTVTNSSTSVTFNSAQAAYYGVSSPAPTGGMPFISAVSGGTTPGTTISSCTGSGYPYTCTISNAWLGTSTTLFAGSYATIGDSWFTTQANSGTIFSWTADTNGIEWSPTGTTGQYASSNMALRQISNTTVGSVFAGGMQITNVNALNTTSPVGFGNSGQGGGDGANWKPYGIIDIYSGGTDYLIASIERNTYGTSGNGYVQPNANGQFITSSDGGATWTPLPSAAALPYASPEWPSTSSTNNNAQDAGFFQCTAGYVSCPAGNGAGTYVYALASANNQPGYPWNGSSLILMRATISNLITHISSPAASDWQFYTGGGGDGNSVSSWCNGNSTCGAGSASPVIQDYGEVGAGQPTWISSCNAWILFTSEFTTSTQIPPVSTFTAAAGGQTVMHVWQSPTPWGKWTKFLDYPANNYGFYWPQLESGSVSGLSAVLLSSGNFESAGVGVAGNYGLNERTATFTCH